MKLGFVLAFVIYWVLTGLFFTFASPYITDASTTAGSFQPNTSVYLSNSSNTTGYIPGSSDLDTSIWGVLGQIAKTLGFMFFGIGLPSGTPAFFQVIFFIVQTGVTILAVIVLLDGLHSG